VSLVVAERGLLALLASYASLGVARSFWLLAHGTVPDWLLPVAASIGLAVALLHRPARLPPSPPTPRWQTILIVLAVAGLVAVVAHGALATESRHWDGVVAWDLKAKALAAEPTLEQPFFRDAAVYSHSRDYPLLQPLALALAERWGLPGRLLFPAAYLSVVIAVAAAARRAGCSTRNALLFGLACGVTPTFVEATSGGFDSGYADGPLAAALAATALGITSRAPVFVAIGTLVTVMQKPEGLPYAGILAAAFWLGRDTVMLRASVIAGALGAAIVLALQHDLHTFGHPTQLGTTVTVVFGAAGVALGLDHALHRFAASWRWRVGLLLVAAPLAAASLGLANGGDGIVGTHFASLDHAFDRLDRLPHVLSFMVQWAFGARFGLTFVLPVVIAFALWRCSGTVAPTLRNWFLLAVPVCCAPFLLAPIEDLERHLRSTMPRLLMHWCGVVWIWSAVQPRLVNVPQVRESSARDEPAPVATGNPL